VSKGEEKGKEGEWSGGPPCVSLNFPCNSMSMRRLDRGGHVHSSPESRSRSTRFGQPQQLSSSCRMQLDVAILILRD